LNIIRSLLPRHHKIFLVTSEQGKLGLKKNEVDEINKRWNDENMELVTFQYHRFGVKKLVSMPSELLQLLRLIRVEKIACIHAVCNIAGSMAYMLSSITRVPLIADSYEPHAEVMVENGTWKKDSLAYKILFNLEKKFTRKASKIIGTTSAMKEYALTRFDTDIKELYVKPACVDFSKFHPTQKDSELLHKYGLENKIVCVYAGKLGGIYLKEEVFDFIKCCYDYWGDRFRFLMLTNAPRHEIDEQIHRLKLPEHIVVSKFCFHEEVPKHLSLGDFGINPVKPGPTRRYCTSIKDGEYWATGLPVIITKNISDDSEIIEQNNIGAVLDDLSNESYIAAISKLNELFKEPREQLQNRVFNVAQRYRNYSIAKEIYSSIYS
jgi:glycosyltransferase involved in cell wall biosynthesis